MSTGKEYVQGITRTMEYIRYNYHHTDGAVFRCTMPVLEECRRERDRRIEKGYLPGDRQIVYDRQSGERLFVLNTNIKGYAVLIEVATARILPVRRGLFFQKYGLSGSGKRAELYGPAEAYHLMLKAYHLHFSNKRNKKIRKNH